MRIGLVFPSFTSDEQELIYPLYHHIVRGISAYHEVTVFALFMEPQHQAGYHWFYNAKVVPLGLAEVTHRALRQFGNALAAKYTVDILHAFGIRWAGNLAAAFRGQKKIPLLINLLSEDFTYPSKTLQYALEAASCLIVPSHHASTQIHQRFPKLAIEKQVIHYGVDINHFVLPQKDHRTRDYLAVGQLIARRNLDLMLHLVARLPSMTLDIVGDGPMRSSLQTLTQSLGIADRVIFHGHQPYETMPHWYQQSRALLVTADESEVFYLPAIEAMACGTEVIGPAVGILPEITTTSSSHQLADLQELILKRQRKHQELKRFQLRLRAQYDFSLEQMLKHYLTLYEKAIHNPA
ncbi:MAG: hypothetical protein CUN55_12835 [Phototrophicales bacterium]|nr:MAG: hypothetical protein CUN55_12835 [Phototrophicales bacterium]